MLTKTNNKKYTLKFLGDKIKHRQNDIVKSNRNINNTNNKNYSPLNNIKDMCTKSSTYLNKGNIVIKKDKNKNKSTKMNSNNVKINIIEKEKEKGNINEYKIHNLSSSYNNNFTNIKTDKILFIDLNNENHNIGQNIENINNNKFKINERYIENINIKINKDKLNNKVVLRANDNKEFNQPNFKITKITNHNNEIKNEIKNTEKKNKTSDNINSANIKFSNLTIQKLNNQEKALNNCIYFIDKADREQKKINEFKNEKKLTGKEYACYILSKSPILRLCERMIFSRSTKQLRNIITKDDKLKENKILLEKKISELKEKIILCNKILNTPFSASKTADITLNFITSLQEFEFKEYPILKAKEIEKKYYVNFIKILYYLLNEQFDDNDNFIISLRANLYSIIKKKGYNSIRDYLYDVYIKKKDNIKEIPNINELNNLINQDKELNDNNNLFHVCKFISFTMFLLKEIIKFGNNINSTIELKMKAKNIIDIIVLKLEKYKNEIENK